MYLNHSLNKHYTGGTRVIILTYNTSCLKLCFTNPNV